jgi:phosphoribulokinase
MPRPVILGVVGDSAAGKTTLTRGLVRVLGEANVTHVCTDDYHRYDRAQRTQLGITPLSPECNYLDIIAQDLAHLRGGQPILKPVYRHQDGTFGAPAYVKPERFILIEGLFGYYLPQMREVYDVRIYLSPPEQIRRRWKVQRDCSRRGYTTDQVLAELDRREADSEAYIRPQRRWADMLVSFTPGGDADARDQSRMDAELTLYDGLPHPDLTPFVNAARKGPTLVEGDGCRLLRIPGVVDPELAAAIEEAIWGRMQFATHLRARRLGEFTVGTELFRSESLALVQLLILYHLVTARATVALGGQGTRAARAQGAGEASATFSKSLWRSDGVWTRLTPPVGIADALHRLIPRASSITPIRSSAHQGSFGTLH